MFISAKINLVWEKEKEKPILLTQCSNIVVGAKNGQYCLFFGFCLVALGYCDGFGREEANIEEAREIETKAYTKQW